MTTETREELRHALRDARQQGSITAGQAREIVRIAIKQTDGTFDDARQTTKEAASEMFQALGEAGTATAEDISATTQALVAAVTEPARQAAETTFVQSDQIAERLRTEEEAIAQRLTEAFDGIMDAAADLDDETRDRVSTAIAAAKLHYSEALGLTTATVRRAVERAIGDGDDHDTEETVAQIVSGATRRSLGHARLTSERARAAASDTLGAAIAGAEESGQHLEEVIRGAVKGIRQGLTTARAEAAEATHKDAEAIHEHLADIEDIVSDAIRRVAKRSGQSARSHLEDLADKTRDRTTSTARLLADDVTTVATAVWESAKEAVTEVRAKHNTKQ